MKEVSHATRHIPWRPRDWNNPHNDWCNDGEGHPDCEDVFEQGANAMIYAMKKLIERNSQFKSTEVLKMNLDDAGDNP